MRPRRVLPGFVALTGAAAASGSFGFVRPEAADIVAAELAAHGSLARAIRGWRDPLALSGRGGILAARPPGAGPAERWVVRPYRRGGGMAPLLGDRHLGLGRPRPWTEVLAVQALERAGVATPTVVAGIVHPAGVWYRAELVTGFVENARDLADLLFGPRAERDPVMRQAFLAAAGAMVAQIAAAGVFHRDLNAKNLLVLPGSPGADGSVPPQTPALAVLDLDRAVVGLGSTKTRKAMASRLARSLGSFETRSGTPLPADEWAAFRHAVRTSA